MLNILIVEDDVTIRELLNYNLKKKFKILEANSAEEAIDVCDNNNIHLILLDWMLPEMSGLSFLRTLKKQKSNSGIPIIFVTAREDEKDIENGLISKRCYLNKQRALFLDRDNTLVKCKNGEYITDLSQISVFSERIKKINQICKEYDMVIFNYKINDKRPN